MFLLFLFFFFSFFSSFFMFLLFSLFSGLLEIFFCPQLIQDFLCHSFQKYFLSRLGGWEVHLGGLFFL